MKYTEEQEALFKTIDAEGCENVLLSSVAGSGKTTTMIGLAEQIVAKHPAAKILYLVFNKSMQLEAERKFESRGLSKNVDVKTAHSFAYRLWAQTIGEFEARNNLDLNIMTNYLYRNSRIPRDYKYTKHSVMTALHNDLTTQKTPLDLFIKNLEKAIDTESKEHTFTLPNGKTRTVFGYEYRPGIMLKPLHPSLFKQIMKEHETQKIYTHAMYLKEAALKNKKIKANYSYLIFDEAQDANPFMYEIAMRLPVQQRWFVGDERQAIYQFMKCINVFTEVSGGKRYELTQSFRFGQEIADIQAVINGIHIKGTEQEHKVVDDKRRTILFRTNAGMLEYAIKLVTENEPGTIKLVYSSPAGTNVEGGLKDSQIANLYYFYKVLLEDGYRDEAEWLNQTFAINYYKDKYGNLRPSSKDNVPGCFKDAVSFMETCNQEREIGDPILSFRDVCKLVQIEGTDVGRLDKLYEDYGKNICQIMAKLIEAENGEIGNRTVYFLCTAHKSKGLEWDDVTIAGDFTLIDDKGKKVKNFWDEMNLIYVAMTRGRYRLDATSLCGPLNAAGVHVAYNDLIVDVSDNPRLRKSAYIVHQSDKSTVADLGTPPQIVSDYVEASFNERPDRGYDDEDRDKQELTGLYDPLRACADEDVMADVYSDVQYDGCSAIIP